MTDPQHPHPPSEHPSDAELITLVRAGDSAAYEHLFLRHREVAIRYARRISDSERAEDLCAEAFTKILDLLQRGKGPDVAFRAYLLTTVRTSHLNAIRAGSREELVPDHEPIARMMPVVEDPDARFDTSAICRAFTSLPERWQAALWLTTVEGLSNEEAGRHLGVKVNAVASLSFRARAGLRQAYLSEHLLETTDPRCRGVVEILPLYLRDALSARRRLIVETHLETCTACAAAALELSEVDQRLGALLAPLLLGGFTVAGAVTVIPAASTGLLASALAHAKSFGAAAPGLIGAKGAVAAAVTAAALGVGVAVGPDHGTPQPPATSAPAPRVEVEGPGGLVRGVPTPTPTGTAGPVLVSPPLSRPAPDHGPAGTSQPAPSTTPAPAPVQTAPTPAPSPTSTTTAAPRMSVEEPTSWTYTHQGVRWEQVRLQVTEPVKNATIVITTNRTIQYASAITNASGWICGTPVVQWFTSGGYASTRVACMYNGNGDGTPIWLHYQVAQGSLFTAALTPPAGVPDAVLTDNLRELLLR